MGAGLVIVAQLLDRSFHSVQAIERSLGLNVIGTLPVVESQFFEKQRRRRLLRWIMVIIAVAVMTVVGFFVIYPRLG
jgi:capsular polysaccharide biosynthesis protein